ncbi:long-chain acyl-CoA synthetase [Desulfonauticus submarinus]|uniref:Long-chain acyl-CoA synthetase n=1 Tax=Desulfonauticus submarinus TaxID=206665 RepID=A0A1G9ZUB1_9BACT|nr:AMP-binding protein [Desulfonauticus submarinus]SDN24106.1 long-chain acyl-CoA synthetase [Desulfonauticus submarinus]
MESKPYYTTLPQLLLKNAQKWPNKTALREKYLGIWQKFSWDNYYQHTASFAAGLKKLGLKQDDILILIGDNRPEWLFAEIAIQSLKGIALGLYQDAQASEIKYIFELTQAKVVVAEDQEQVDKILSIRNDLPHLKYIIYHDSKGLHNYQVDGLLDFKKVEKLGESESHLFPKWAKNTHPEDICLIATTSGTTGKPKLAMLSHVNLLSMAWNLGLVDPKYPSDEFVSFLPLAWMGEQMMATASALLFGFCVNFPEEPDTVQENIREIGPHLIFSPPRVWENLAAKVQVKIMETTPLKRFLFNLFYPWGVEYADKILNQQPLSIITKLKYFLANLFLFRALRDRLGFSRIRSASTGGAALGPDTFRFFHALGINLKQIYGQTEISGISCIHRNKKIDFDTVGEPIPETQIKISQQGEILSKSPAVFKGYYKNKKATEETLESGWLKSGDAGYFKENGQLVVIDRLKDVMHLKNGTKFSPQFLENKLKFSPYIKEAMVIGEGKDFIVAIICIDMDIVGRFAEQKLITYTTYQDLASKPEIYALIEKEISSINKTLPQNIQIKSFALLFKELDADDGELTRTKKIRRKFVAERYKKLIDAMYENKNKTILETEIVYQDGSKKLFKGEIKIRKLE